MIPVYQKCIKCEVGFYNKFKSSKKKYCSVRCSKLDRKRPNFSGENNPEWKGDKVGYWGLHLWVARWLGKPDVCEACGNDTLNHRSYQWANLSGKYLRELSDWIRLCKPCHTAHDYNLAKI